LGAVYLDPSLRFETIETSHFLIHFHQGEMEMAEKLAAIAEDVHSKLSNFMEWSPKSKTQVLLLDIWDEANGMATPIPYNAIVILSSQPGPEEAIVYYDDWLKLVFVHEYTHILHLDQVRGYPRVLQSILGRLYFPNLFQPLWLIEGLSTFQESSLTGGGRGKGSFFDMIIRSAFLEGKLNSIDQGNGDLALWPGGHFPYLYGVMFYMYLADRYGEEKISKLTRETSYYFLPFSLNSPPLNIYGKDYNILWSEWVASLQDKYNKQLKAIKEKPITNPRKLTSRGYGIRGPVFSPDGKNILYTEMGPVEYPSLRVIGKDGKGDRKLTDRNDGIFSSWSRDGKSIVFSQSEAFRSFSLFNDIYILEDNKLRRIGKGMRLEHPDISPDGSEIACIRIGLGKTDLGVFRPDSRAFTPILNGDDYTRFSSPRWSPDGKRIALSAFRPGGFREILIIDRATGEIFTVAGSNHLNIFPNWSLDGAFIVYSSDRTGVSNLYAYSIEDGRTFQITNLVGGAFESSVSPDGKEIAFTGYSAEGFDIYLTEFAPQKGWEVKPLTEPKNAKSKDLTPVESRPYSPMDTVLPRFWVPIMDYSTQNGFSLMALTWGTDVLMRHSYTAAALYRAQVNKAGGYLNYQNDALLPSITAQGMFLPYASYTFTDSAGEENTIWETEAGGSLNVSFPLLFFRSSHSLSAGYNYRDIRPINHVPEYLIDPPEEGKFAGVTFGYNYTSSLRFPLSISQEDGQSFSISYELLSRELGSDFDTQRLMADIREYLSIPLVRPSHVLAIRIAGGTGWGEILNRRAFHMGGNGREETLLGIEQKEIYLRGYRPGAFRGQKALLFSSEYRLPITIIQRGCWTWPFFFEKLSLSLFFDTGYAWDEDNVPFKDFREGIGAELKMDTTLFYLLPLTLTAGFAKGTDRDGIRDIYFTIGSAF